MEWTPELDATLTELHGKRLGNMFIATWMRLKPADVRLRLIELGLVARPVMRPPALASRGAGPAPAATAQGLDDDADDDDNSDLVQLRGRPRGHLITERRIADLYRSAGRAY